MVKNWTEARLYRIQPLEIPFPGEIRVFVNRSFRHHHGTVKSEVTSILRIEPNRFFKVLSCQNCIVCNLWRDVFQTLPFCQAPCMQKSDTRCYFYVIGILQISRFEQGHRFRNVALISLMKRLPENLTCLIRKIRIICQWLVSGRKWERKKFTSAQTN